MNTIAFIDTEVDPTSGKILDIGSVKNNGSYFHSASIKDFIHFLNGTKFVCGHNILKHDIKYVGEAIEKVGINSTKYN